ncbi:MAG: type II secretion system F family protein [Candidatus Diapherotrites archaeon]|nr:type II secretion system F family protein [Candidatus Diapherotrites archaeon]
MEENKKKGLKIFNDYKRMLQQSKFRTPAELWVALSAMVSLALAILAFTLITALSLPVSPIMALVLFLVLIDVMLGYPWLLAVKRIDSIEADFPDALKQMADTLKAGGTYEFALREIATSEYSHLSEEMEIVLRKMEEGENLENSLIAFSENIDSTLIKRTVAIIIDSIKAGAGLADVLDEIADDVRAMHRIAKERIAETTMQVIFIVAAGSIVAPAILGLISTVLNLFINSSIGFGMTKEQITESVNATKLIALMMQGYLVIEVVASGGMIAITREGRISKSIIYTPILLLIAFTCYYLAAFASGTLIGGMA